MVDEFRESLIRKIDDVQGHLGALRNALKAYDKAKHGAVESRTAADTRFANMTPTYRAIEIVLRESGGKMTRADLMTSLIDGGAMIGRKRGVHNLRLSIDKNIELGKIFQRGESVEIPRLK